jgi:hypothetical protein
MLRPTASVPSTASDPQGLSLEPGTVTDCQALRSVINVKDSLLRERTFKWLATLPAHVRPMGFPSVVRHELEVLQDYCALIDHRAPEAPTTGARRESSHISIKRAVGPTMKRA